MTTPSITWIQAKDAATCSVGNWQARVVWERFPSLSFVNKERESAFQIRIAPQDAQDRTPTGHGLKLGDSYVRQSDLIAVFPEASPFRFGYQVYFCAKPHSPDAILLELWLSVQTSTLEAHPQLKLSIEGCSLEASGSSMYLNQDRLIGLLVHPLDAHDCKLYADESRKQSILAFGRFMEKGVIRRMRCQVVASSRGLASDDWQQLLDTFSQSPLPLTA